MFTIFYYKKEQKQIQEKEEFIKKNLIWVT